MTTSTHSDDPLEEGVSASPAGTRRKAREIALQGLYAFELSENSVQKVCKDLADFFVLDPAVFEFSEQLIEKTAEYREEIDRHIREHTDNWEFERIAIIDRLILRMAICEFLHFWDIPPKVSIDEAIELSKQFSTEQSGRFVNGILDAVLVELKKGNLLIKTGRGLRDETD
ncbi:MAG TPA: transcription antitermination factor NusB [bacterium]|nr:transcription antitermination factor NusB [bacterium]HNT64914.1 transcription antitermination factor NusB [bacterium]HOX84919.1 transcription antitermination factor NusB [bacterium]HPG44215.1 transcription antitermination factor NusB [bacterium]HPM96582.1 transcription antitermination factor NusB [bacterium]